MLRGDMRAACVGPPRELNNKQASLVIKLDLFALLPRAYRGALGDRLPSAEIPRVCNAQRGCDTGRCSGEVSVGSGSLHLPWEERSGEGVGHPQVAGPPAAVVAVSAFFFLRPRPLPILIVRTLIRAFSQSM